MLLVGRTLVGVTRRYRNAIDAELSHGIEEGGDTRRVRIVEEGAVDGDAEALRLGRFERLDSAVVDAWLADRLVMHLLVAVEMDRPGEIGARLVLIDLLFEQQRIGADDRKFFARNDSLDDLCQGSVQQRFAARHDDHRSAAFIDRGQRVFDGYALVKDGVGIVDLAAARASEVAAKQRLQHQNQRVALAAREMLPNDIGADSYNLPEGYAHDRSLQSQSQSQLDEWVGPAQFASSAGRRKLTVSAGPSRTESSDGAIADKVRTTSSTTISGADAPAVTPTTAASRTHSGS